MPAVLEQAFGARMEILRHLGVPVVVDCHATTSTIEAGRRHGRVSGRRCSTRSSTSSSVKGLVAALARGRPAAGFIGVFITLRGMSYIGHGLSHAIFGGFAAAPAARHPDPAGRRPLGPRLGSGHQRRDAPAPHRRRRRDRCGHDRVVRARRRAADAVRQQGPGLRQPAVRQHQRRRDGPTCCCSAVSRSAPSPSSRVLYRQLLFTTFDPEVAEVSGVNVGAHGHDPHDRAVDVDPRDALRSSASRWSRRRS